MFEYDNNARLIQIKKSPTENSALVTQFDAAGNILVSGFGAQSLQPPIQAIHLLQPEQAGPYYEQTHFEWRVEKTATKIAYFNLYIGETQNTLRPYRTGIPTTSTDINELIPDTDLFWKVEGFDVHHNRYFSPIYSMKPGDTDQDGIIDFIEKSLCTDPNQADTDQDGLLDGQENQPPYNQLANSETDPCNPDTDGDGMPDGYEVAQHLDPLSDDADLDPDKDHFSNIEEYLAGTDPHQGNDVPAGTWVTFEQANQPTPFYWFNEGDAPWTLETDNPITGKASYHSGEIVGGQQSVLRTRVNATGGLLRFDLQVSSEDKYDKLYLYINGREEGSWSGDISGPVQIALPKGTQEIKWIYQKDGSIDQGQDKVWIDNLFISSEPDSDHDGMADALELEYFSTLDQDLSADYDQDGLSNREEIEQGLNPTQADTDADRMPDGYEVAQHLNPKLDDANLDPDTDHFTNFEEYLAGTDPHQGNDAPAGTWVDFEQANQPTPFYWFNEGDAPWTLETSTPITGKASYRSGLLKSGKHSTLRTVVNSTGGLLRFDLKTDTSSYYDRLYLYINGRIKGDWSGQSSHTVQIALPKGKQEIKFYYSQSSSEEQGHNKVWIDNLFISAEPDHPLKTE